MSPFAAALQPVQRTPLAARAPLLDVHADHRRQDIGVQGNRILIGLEMSEEGFEGVVVPAGLFAFASQAA